MARWLLEKQLDMFRIAFLLCVCLAVASPAAANPFARADDTRVPAPEQRKRPESFGLDLSLGGSYLSGNVDHFALAPAAKLSVRRGPHQLFVDARSNYSAFSGNAVIDRHNGSALYAYAIADHWNVFVYNTHAKNAFTKLDYRTTASGGLCLHSFFGGKRTTPLVSAGLTPELEWWQSGSRERALRGTLRTALSTEPTSHVKVGADAMYEPNLAAAGDFRLYAEGFVELKITDNALALRISVSDEFDSEPQMDVAKNDISVVPSLVVKTGD